MRRASRGAKVPTIVTHLCHYLNETGFEDEGIFRINGSQEVLNKLRKNFDKHGDAKLEKEKDVMAVAGLLKFFLRELETPVIPENMTEKLCGDSERCDGGVEGIQDQVHNNDIVCGLIRHYTAIFKDENERKRSSGLKPTPPRLPKQDDVQPPKDHQLPHDKDDIAIDAMKDVLEELTRKQMEKQLLENSSDS